MLWIFAADQQGRQRLDDDESAYKEIILQLTKCMSINHTLLQLELY